MVEIPHHPILLVRFHSRRCYIAVFTVAIVLALLHCCRSFALFALLSVRFLSSSWASIFRVSSTAYTIISPSWASSNTHSSPAFLIVLVSYLRHSSLLFCLVPSTSIYCCILVFTPLFDHHGALILFFLLVLLACTRKPRDST